MQNEIEFAESKKSFKKRINKMSRTLMYYELAMLFTVIVYTVIQLFQNGGATEKSFDLIYTKTMASGWPSLLGIAVGMVFILLYRKKDLFYIDLAKKNKNMTGKTFFSILFCFLAVQGVFSVVSTGMEAFLNLFGYSLATQIDMASSSSTTISMFLYASFIGPIAEEMVFRGAVLRSLQRYGNNFAIIVSAVSFGFFHANLIQGIFATLVGLVLGYVAMEYSIKWSMLLHIINNFVFGDFLAFILKNLSAGVQNLISYSLIGVISFIGLIILFNNRDVIKVYVGSNRTEKGFYRYTYTSLWMVLFCVANLLMSFDGITKIAS